MKIEQHIIDRHAHGSFSPEYLAIHETAMPGSTAEFIATDVWERSDTRYVAHYIVDWTDKGYQVVPDDQRAWHVGKEDEPGYGNQYCVGVEICHADNAADFDKAWNNAVEFAARFLNSKNWGVDHLITHNECRLKWGGTDHTDPDGYFESNGKSWQDFKSAVSAKKENAGNLESVGGGAGGGGAADAVDSEGVLESAGSAVQVSYFVANQFKTLQADAMSELLMGERAIANDVTLWSSVQAAVNASMRACCSAPDGSFIAWYPDYWGVAGLDGMSHSAPKVELDDMELINLTITQSDDEFYSHVFTAGVNINGASDPNKLLYTVGVVSVESNVAASIANAATNAEIKDKSKDKDDGDNKKSTSKTYDVNEKASDKTADILKKLIYIPEGDDWKYSPRELYRRYGARPIVSSKAAHLGAMSNVIEDMKADGDTTEGSGVSVDKNPRYILPFLCALYEFMDHWANQYRANLEMTFMPELFPGCRIKLKSFDISFYVQSVTHNINYESGFTTTAKCICPIGSLVSGMVQPKG